MDKIYTGIGSRSTPPEMLTFLSQLAKHLDDLGWTLRSGAAEGADAAFEQGGMRNEIYLPWAKFNGHLSNLYGRKVNSKEAELLVKEIHPCWYRLKPAPRKLHIRNAFQVLGAKLDKPSVFVACWTPGGAAVGGTRTAIVLAESRGIPVFNFGGSDPQAVYAELLNLVYNHTP